MAAAFLALRTLGVPALDVWETFLERKKVTLRLREDNKAAGTVMKTGRNPNMRHIERCMGVNVAWLHNLFRRNIARLKMIATAEQRADILTKAFKSSVVWEQLSKLIQLRRWDASKDAEETITRKWTEMTSDVIQHAGTTN